MPTTVLHHPPPYPPPQGGREKFANEAARSSPSPRAASRGEERRSELTAMKADAHDRAGLPQGLGGRPGRGARSSGTSIVRSRLFIKYAALFVTVVVLALVANAAFDVWFSYSDRKASLIDIQRQDAQAAAG